MMMRWMAIEVAIHHSRREAVTESRASVNFSSSMISFSKAMGAVFFMGERVKVGERRAGANKKIARGGTHKY
jgi:hypothetical protein